MSATLQYLEKNKTHLPTKTDPIGVFDSGIGGLTVLKRLQTALPHESFNYFGDTARVPYGNKSRDTVTRYAIENSIFLMEKRIKLLVVACHTASSVALEKLQELFRIPVMGVIDAAVSAAAEATKNGKIAVLGTKGTIQSAVYQQAFENGFPEIEVTAQSCPLFVPFVEEGWQEHPACDLVIEEYLKEVRQASVDTVILGCTHYPLLQAQIQKKLGGDVRIIDSSEALAKAIKTHLVEDRLANDREERGNTEYFVSDDKERFRILGERFLGGSIEKVTQV